MLSVYLNASRDGINRTHKDFSTAIFLLQRRDQANWSWILGGALYWSQRSPVVLLGEGHMGNVGLALQMTVNPTPKTKASILLSKLL